MNIKEKISHYTSALELLHLLNNYGGESRFVGGCIRDLLLTNEISDIDIATTHLPEEVESIFEIAKIPFFSIGKEYGTITALYNSKTYEITTLRLDLNCNGRHAKVQYTKNWIEDAKRRDFTINALSCDINGNVYDYFNGISDLNANKVRFIGNPEDRISEDYLRILRYFRFCSLFSNSLDELVLKIIKNKIHNIKLLSGTRIKNELSKIFLTPNSIHIIEEMFNIGLFEHIFMCNNSIFTFIKNLYDLRTEFQFEVTELMIFGILIKFSKEQATILNSYSFTRSEIILFKSIIASEYLDWGESSLKNYWQLYKENFQQITLINLSIANNKTICKDLIERLFNTTILPCPISSIDIEKIGIKPGVEMGHLLKLANKIWFNHEFKIDKNSLMKDLQLHVNEH